MDGLLGKLRAFAFDKQGVGRDLGLSGESPKACFLCDAELGIQGWAQCSICGYVFCGQCCPTQGNKGGAGTLRPNNQDGAPLACEFCRHLRLGSLTQESLDAAGDLATARQGSAPSPYTLSRLSSAASIPAQWQRQGSSTLHRMSRAGSTVHRQVVGDLTWEVPTELEPDYGLSLEDKRAKQLRKSNPGGQGDAAAGPAGGARADAAAQAMQQQQQQGLLELQGMVGQRAGPQQLSLGPAAGAPTAGRSLPGEAFVPAATAAPPPTWGILQSLSAAGAAPPTPTSLVGLQRQLLGAAATQHLQRLVGQLLVSEGVADPGVWAGVLVRLACEAAALVLPPMMVSNGVLDPRHYIKVKKLADIGRPSDSCVLPAVVCKRNVAHRRMRTHLRWPKVVLLGGALEHQRSEERLSSIETLIEQEPDQLRSAVRYIASLGTELLVVERSVARAAQEELLARGMTLVLNVKAELMERLARCMGTCVAHSVEELDASHVGTCREFRVDPLAAHATAAGPGPPGLHATVTGGGGPDGVAAAAAAGAEAGRAGAAPPLRGPAAPAAAVAAGVGGGGAAVGGLASSTRTLMSFGCAVPLGATLLVKGADVATLARVKRVARFAVLAAYAARLESAFLAEEMVAALAACRGEVPCSADQGGLASFRAASAPIIAASARNAATCMPNGVVLALTPHLSVWDQSIAAECDEAVWAVAAVAASARPPLPAMEGGLQQQQQQQQQGKGAGSAAAAGLDTADGVLLNGSSATTDSSSGRSSKAHNGLPAPNSAAAAASGPPAGSQASQAVLAAAAPAAVASNVLPAGAGALSAPTALNGQPAPPAAAGAAAAGANGGPCRQGGASAERELAGAGAGVQGSSTAPAGAEGAARTEPLQEAADAAHSADASPQLAAVLKLKALQGLQVYDYQRIQISMSCRNPKKQLLCEPHCVKRIDFYAPTDMSLLQFILAASPSPYKRCTMLNCADGVTAHVRSFLHGSARITISIATVAASEALPNEDKQQVWMWLRPKGRGAAARMDVRRLPLSPESACMSLGHFLQLTFTADCLDVGGRCLHHDFVRYFGLGRSVICMYQDRISPYTVLMPKLACVYGLPAQLKWLKQEAVELEKEAHEAFSQIQGALHHQPRLLQQHAPASVGAELADASAAATTGGAAAPTGEPAAGPTSAAAPPPQPQPQLQPPEGHQTEQGQPQGQQEQQLQPLVSQRAASGSLAPAVQPQPPAAKLPRPPSQQQLWQQLQQQAGLKVLQHIINQDKAAFMAKVSACLQRPLGHPCGQDALQEPLTPPPPAPAALPPASSMPSARCASSPALQEGAPAVQAGMEAGTDVAGGAARAAAAVDDADAKAAAAVAPADPQPPGTSAVVAGPKEQGIRLDVGALVPHSESNFMGASRAGGDGQGSADAGAADASATTGVEESGVCAGAATAAAVAAVEKKEEEEGPDSGSIPATVEGCEPGTHSAVELAGRVDGGGTESGAGGACGGGGGGNDRGAPGSGLSSRASMQPQQQLQQQVKRPADHGLGWSVEGEMGRLGPWESEVVAGLCELNQLRRSLAVTLLSWAANLQDPDCFVSLCSQAQSLQQQQQQLGGAEVASPSPSPPLLNGAGGVGGGQGHGGTEGTLALMQQLEAEAATAGLLPVPIIASSAGPISIQDVASLAVGTARSQAWPAVLGAALGAAGEGEGTGEGKAGSKDGIGGGGVAGMWAAGATQPHLLLQPSHREQQELQGPGQGEQQQQQQQEQQGQGQGQGQAVEEQEQDDEDDESYKCYGRLHAPLADAGMAGDDDDETTFYPQGLPSCTEEEHAAATPLKTPAGGGALAAAARVRSSGSSSSSSSSAPGHREGDDGLDDEGAGAADAAAAPGPVDVAVGCAQAGVVLAAAAAAGPAATAAGVHHSSSMPTLPGSTGHAPLSCHANGSYGAVDAAGREAARVQPVSMDAARAGGMGGRAQEAGGAGRPEDMVARAQSLGDDKQVGPLAALDATPPRQGRPAHHAASRSFSTQEASPFSALAATTMEHPATARKLGVGPNQGQGQWLLSKGQADSRPLVHLGGNAPIIGRLCMPGRTLLPSGIEDSVVPIHDCEPSSIIAHCLASRPYHLLLNAAIKSMFMELRRGRPGAGQRQDAPLAVAPAYTSAPAATGSGAAEGGGVGEAGTSMTPPAASLSHQPAEGAGPTNAPSAAAAEQAAHRRSGQASLPSSAQPERAARSTLLEPQAHASLAAGTAPAPQPRAPSPLPPATPEPKGQPSSSGACNGSGSSRSSSSAALAGSLPSSPPAAGVCSSSSTSSLAAQPFPSASSLHKAGASSAAAAATMGGSSSSSSTTPPPASTLDAASATPAGAAAAAVPASPGPAVRADGGTQGWGNGGAVGGTDPGPAGAAGGAQPRPGGGGGLQLGDLDWLSIMLSHEPMHLRHAFEDEGLGMPWTRAKFQVVCFFAPQFAELRRRVVQGGEVSYVASLSRCVRWAQRGGKSNAYFAKTRDDRYIIKSMSKAEKASFLEFAPAYFEHAAKSALSGQRTCLAKVLGMYQVTAKTQTGASGLAATNAGKDGVLDLLVMENCFYDQQISRIYDLKGSERNRFNADAAANPHDAKEVHLDDNLRRANLSAPLMVTPSSQRQLELALWADTAFLSGLAIMDYSLLVGVDKDDHVLAVAIIDFIRQYTWDKQLETWVKGSGILGGGGKEPTIISPKQYMRRFRTAIMSYFTVVPGSAEMACPLDPDS